MKEVFVERESLPEAYHDALKNLWRQGQECDCSYGGKQKEISLTMSVLKPLKEPRISKLTYTGPEELQSYVMEFVDGTLDWAIRAGKEKYTYHDRYAPYVDNIIRELHLDSASRRAVIPILLANDGCKEGIPCLNHMQFMVRNGALDMKILMRSNDACKATFQNCFAFITLQEHIAKKLQLPVGSYTHRVNSFHVYERDYKMLDGYMKRILASRCVGDMESLCCFYDGDWKEEMNSCIDKILNDVNAVRERNLKHV